MTASHESSSRREFLEQCVASVHHAVRALREEHPRSKDHQACHDAPVWTRRAFMRATASTAIAMPLLLSPELLSAVSEIALDPESREFISLRNRYRQAVYAYDEYAVHTLTYVKDGSGQQENAPTPNPDMLEEYFGQVYQDLRAHVARYVKSAPLSVPPATDIETASDVSPHMQQTMCTPWDKCVWLSEVFNAHGTFYSAPCILGGRCRIAAGDIKKERRAPPDPAMTTLVAAIMSGDSTERNCLSPFLQRAYTERQLRNMVPKVGGMLIRGEKGEWTALINTDEALAEQIEAASANEMGNLLVTGYTDFRQSTDPTLDPSQWCFTGPTGTRYSYGQMGELISNVAQMFHHFLKNEETVRWAIADKIVYQWKYSCQPFGASYHGIRDLELNGLAQLVGFPLGEAYDSDEASKIIDRLNTRVSNDRLWRFYFGDLSRRAEMIDTLKGGLAQQIHEILHPPDVPRQ